MSLDMSPLKQTVIFDKLDEIRELSRRYNVQRLDAFGSVLRDDFDLDRSDLDFLVEFKAMAPEDHADRFIGFLRGLEELFGREVDLVERKNVKNPYIGQAIYATRVLIYDAA